MPVYFTPSRNAHGIIGPISLDQFTPESLQQRIAANPLASQAYKAGSKPRIAVVTNSTYDGLCYNAEKIADEIGSAVDFLHFDEAWYAYAAFHRSTRTTTAWPRASRVSRMRSFSPRIPPTSCWLRSRRRR